MRTMTVWLGAVVMVGGLWSVSLISQGAADEPAAPSSASEATGGAAGNKTGGSDAVPPVVEGQPALPAEAGAVQGRGVPGKVRLQNFGKLYEYVNIQFGPVVADAIQPGWLSAQWTFEPVNPGSKHYYIRNVWKSDQLLNIESGPLVAGPIQPGWLSAQWTLEPVPGTVTSYYIRNVWKPDMYLNNTGHGKLLATLIEPTWTSAMWILSFQTVVAPPPPPVVPQIHWLKNHWKPDQYVNIESGLVVAGAIQRGWLSAQWTLELIPGSTVYRIRNVWKPDLYLNVQSGLQASTIAPGWVSARWTLEPVTTGSALTRIRNVWQTDLYLNIESGALVASAIQPGWLSAQWTLETMPPRLPGPDLVPVNLSRKVGTVDPGLFCALVVTAVTGDMPNLGISVANIGTAPAPASHAAVAFDVHGILQILEEPVQSIEPNSGATARFLIPYGCFNPATHKCNFTIVLDSRYEVVESGEHEVVGSGEDNNKVSGYCNSPDPKYEH